MRTRSGFKKVQYLQLHSLVVLRISSTWCWVSLRVDVGVGPVCANWTLPLGMLPPLDSLKLDFLTMSFVPRWSGPFSRTPFVGAVCFNIDFGIPFTSTLTVFLWLLLPLILVAIESTAVFRFIAMPLAWFGTALSFASKFRLRRFSFGNGTAFRSNPCTVKSSTSQLLTLL